MLSKNGGRRSGVIFTGAVAKTARAISPIFTADRIIAAYPDLMSKVTVSLADIERRQAAHLAGLVRDPDALEYLDRVLRIGSIHVRIGLTPESYVAGYASILGSIQTENVRSMVREFLSEVA